MTNRELPIATERVELVAAEVDELARDLTERYDHVWVVGGARLARVFLRSDSIDELRLSVVPPLLGDGRSPFGESGPDRELALIESVTHENAVVELRYAVGAT
ncbi:dihydrofolate reductase family protein [Halosolutus halophilus]|uniref:dihydrofolate reductase family protein n=1 Tax=Halosolutus halophilus TaxID=1552990 RepID=UPI0022350C38|nr:dihydrofolate reductase family protein [Halosolutus halophilus]